MPPVIAASERRSESALAKLTGLSGADEDVFAVDWPDGIFLEDRGLGFEEARREPPSMSGIEFDARHGRDLSARACQREGAELSNPVERRTMARFPERGSSQSKICRSEP